MRLSLTLRLVRPPTAFRRGLVGLAFAGLVFGVSPSAQAAFNNTTPRASFAGNINYTATGNTLRTQSNSGNPCAVNTFSGNEPLTVPVGATIVAAYLYWAGSGPTNNATVTFTNATTGNSQSVTDDANFSDIYVFGTQNLHEFGDFKDITSLGIVTTGSNQYNLSGLTVQSADLGGDLYCSDAAVQSGWSLIVVYQQASENNRVINIYDGIQAFRGSQITTTPTNFQVPTSPIDGKFTVVTWEGDVENSAALNGFSEALTFNGTTLTDTCDPLNNQYNSTINTLICTGAAEPGSDNVFYGVDIDTYNISAELTAGETSANLIYSSGGDLVWLAVEVISTTNTNVSDLAITKSHSGTFYYGGNAVWTLAVTNNGPNSTAGTTTVSDTLPTGLTYVSASGTGWTCGAAGQVVTCTNTTVVASGSSFPSITLTASIGATTVSPMSNTATVSGANFDNHSSNNTSTDSGITIVQPNLSTSYKDVVNTSGGYALVGNTLQYTITLVESNGVPANNVSVTDNVPANLTGFTVTTVPSGATNSSTGAGTGTNNDGFLNITGITVPANGSVTISFAAQVATGTADCTAINNAATVTNPYGPGATPTAPTVTVNQSVCGGSKILYVYDNTGPTYTNLLNRIVQTVNTGTGITVNNGANHQWLVSPVLAKNLVLPAGNVSVSLVVTNTNTGTTTRRPTTVSLLNNGVAVATSATVNTNNSATPLLLTYTIALASATTFSAGNTIGIQFNNNSGTANQNVLISQKTAAQGNSKVSFTASTVINVDSITAYTGNYTGTGTPATVPVFSPGKTVFLCAVISDPFGSYDVDPSTLPQLTLVDPTGTVQVNAQNMTLNGGGGKDCSGTTNSAVNSYEYSFALPATAPPAAYTKAGFWTVSVKAFEGSEGTVNSTSSSTFDVDLPSLLMMKTVLVSTDPTGDAIAHSIPGATVQYTILVQNNGRGPADSGTFLIADAVPANTVMSLPTTPPFTFTDGAQPSGLSITSGTDANIVYSNNGGTTYAYVPGCTRPCTDSAITNFKITPNGSMNGKTGATAPSFTITFKVVVQ